MIRNFSDTVFAYANAVAEVGTNPDTVGFFPFALKVKPSALYCSGRCEESVCSDTGY